MFLIEKGCIRVWFNNKGKDVVCYVYKRNLSRLLDEIKEIPHLRDMFIDKVFERTFDYMKYFISSIMDTPQQRYPILIKERPEIVKRVPQHYIASYLGH